MKFQTSPLKPKKLIKPKNVSGIKLSSVATSIKYRNRDDLMLMSMSPKTKVFGFLTKSSTASPAVLWCKKVLKNKKARALIVNAGISTFNAIATFSNNAFFDSESTFNFMYISCL